MAKQNFDKSPSDPGKGKGDMKESTAVHKAMRMKPFRTGGDRNQLRNRAPGQKLAGLKEGGKIGRSSVPKLKGAPPKKTKPTPTKGLGKPNMAPFKKGGKMC